MINTLVTKDDASDFLSQIVDRKTRDFVWLAQQIVNTREWL